MTRTHALWNAGLPRMLLLASVIVAGCSGPARQVRPGKSEVRLGKDRARLMACVIQDKGLKLAKRSTGDLAAHLAALGAAVGKVPQSGTDSWTDASGGEAATLSRITFSLGPMGPQISGEAAGLQQVAGFLGRLNQAGQGVSWRLDQARLAKGKRFRFLLRSDPELRVKVVERATDLAQAQAKGKGMAAAVKATCPAGVRAPATPPKGAGVPAWEIADVKATPLFKLGGLTVKLQGDLATATDQIVSGAGSALPEGFTGARLVVGADGARLTLLWHAPKAPAPGVVKRWLQQERQRNVSLRLPRWPWLERSPTRPPFPRGDEGWDLSAVKDLRASERATLSRQLDLWVKRRGLRRGLHALRALQYHQRVSDRIFTCLFRAIQPEWPFARDGSIVPQVVADEQRLDEQARGYSRQGAGPMAALRSFDGEQLGWQLRPPGKSDKQRARVLKHLDRCRVLQEILVDPGSERGAVTGSAEVAHPEGGRARGGAGGLAKLDAASRARQLLLGASKTEAEVATLEARAEKAAGRFPAEEGLEEVIKMVTNVARLQQLRLKLARRVPSPRSRGAVRHAVLELQLAGSRLGVIMLLDSIARSNRVLLPVFWRWEEMGQTRWGRLRLLLDLPYLAKE